MNRHASTPAGTAGWTFERRMRFLRSLRAGGNVRRACAAIGLSRQSVFKLRLRDSEFARVWDAAVELARSERERRSIAALLARLGGVPAGGSEARGESVTLRKMEDDRRGLAAKPKSAEYHGVAPPVDTSLNPPFGVNTLPPGNSRKRFLTRTIPDRVRPLGEA